MNNEPTINYYGEDVKVAIFRNIKAVNGEVYIRLKEGRFKGQSFWHKQAEIA